MSDEQEVTLGEVFRLCQRIEEKVDRTNGTVNRHETRITVLETQRVSDPAARWTGIGALIAGLGSGFFSWWQK